MGGLGEKVHSRCPTDLRPLSELQRHGLLPSRAVETQILHYHYGSWQRFFKAYPPARRSALRSPGDSTPAPPFTGCEPKAQSLMPTRQTWASRTKQTTKTSPNVRANVVRNKRG